ncbi:MAG TPA: shikimate kinase [Prosthecobacter sp.]|nr:shikimate kinase [Prosthecobacter sp.]
MRVLIVGCGYVGERTADLLHEAGHTVVGVTYSPESAARLAAEKPWQCAACDISDAAAVATLGAELGNFDAFIHCASSSKGGGEVYEAVYVAGLGHLIATFPGAFPLFTSSTSVYPQTDGSEVDESNAVEPAKDTGRLLRQAEQIALAAGGGVARLAGIYGPGRSFVLKNLLEGKAGIEVTAEAPDGRFLNQIHRDDAAAALAHLAATRSPGIFNVVDGSQTTQRECLERLAVMFGVMPASDRPPDPGGKRGWSHKRVSNSKLRMTGWQPKFPDYFHALHHDPDLAASILELVMTERPAEFPRAENVVLIGLMGSGKSTVGRQVAHMLGFPLLDTDTLIIESAKCSIPEIFAREGESGFRRRESAALRLLLGCRHHVIATGGGIVTQPRNRPLLRHLGFVTWLEADPVLLARRTAANNDRPLLQGEEPPLQKLQRLLAERSPLYQQLADLRIQTDDLSQEESAYGIAESARVYFARRRIAMERLCPPPLMP